MLVEQVKIWIWVFPELSCLSQPCISRVMLSCLQTFIKA